MQVPKDMTPDKLRKIADFLDLGDRLAEMAAADLGKVYTAGNEVQRDVRRWADEIEKGE